MPLAHLARIHNTFASTARIHGQRAVMTIHPRKESRTWSTLLASIRNALSRS